MAVAKQSNDDEVICGAAAHAHLLGVGEDDFLEHLPDMVRRGYPVDNGGGQLVASVSAIRKWIAAGDEVQRPEQVELMLDKIYGRDRRRTK